MKRLNLKNCIVTLPDKETAPAVVLYGGLRNLEGDWFLSHHKIPGIMLQNVYFILPTHFTNSCKTCLEEFRAKVDPKNISRYSLCGFSRGAQEVYRNRDLEQWKLFGLVDPSAPTLDIFKEEVLDRFADRTRCVYWVPNWGKDGYKGRVPSYAQHLRDMKVKMVEEEVEHEDMPPFFFKQWGNDFIV